MNEEFINYYNVFGLTSDCTLKEIDKAYQFLLDCVQKSFNAEHSKEEDIKLHEQYFLAKEAYCVLSDPDLKKEYDEKYFDVHKKASKKGDLEEDEVILRKSGHWNGRIDSISNTNKKTPIPQSLKEMYEDVRSDEKRINLKTRHGQISKFYHDNYYKEESSNIKKGVYYLGIGPAHIYFEALYQLFKLGNINKDTFAKYIIRNRRLLASILAGGIVLTNGIVAHMDDNKVIFSSDFPRHQEEIPEEIVEVKKEKPEIKVNLEESSVVLNRYYIVEKGDSLNRLAYNANGSISEIRDKSNYHKKTIHPDQELVIPYHISQEDIEFYIDSVPYYGEELSKFAKKYDTDLESIYKLNSESIIFSEGKYIVLSDSLIVPKFISKVDLIEAQREKLFENR